MDEEDNNLDDVGLDEGTNNDLMGQPTSVPTRRPGRYKSTMVELEDLVDPSNNRVLHKPMTKDFIAKSTL